MLVVRPKAPLGLPGRAATGPACEAYHKPVPSVVLYREGVRAGERWYRCGFGLPLRSFRASWERVRVDVDQGLEFSVRTATRRVVLLPLGRHEISVSGRGFAPSAATVDLTGDQPVIVAITPQYLESVTRATPLGSLRAHVVSGPDELYPYRSYKRWPVFVSALGSASVAVIGAAAVASGLYVLTQHLLVGIVLLACVLVVVPTLLFSGLGGLVMVVRFLRLSSDWRAPRKAGAPVALGPAQQ